MIQYEYLINKIEDLYNIPEKYFSRSIDFLCLLSKHTIIFDKTEKYQLKNVIEEYLSNKS